MKAVFKPYLQVTKPVVVMANLVSVVAGFFMAAGSKGDATLLPAVLVGTGLVIASGCVFNNCIDRHADRLMARTRNRAMAKGQIPLKIAWLYATLLGTGGMLLLWVTTNQLSVAIAASGFAFYVPIYSLWLKRASVHSTLIGSLAGAAPPLIGYCAVNPRLDTGAIMLLLIFSLWQMPHAYALAIHRINDYIAAGFPVLPVCHGIPAARRQIIVYILAFTMAAALPTLGGYAGNRYLAMVLFAGIVWLGLAGWRGKADLGHWARRVFIFSIVSIFLLSMMMALDGRIPASGATFQRGHQWIGLLITN